ncbi:hypothetical protein [Aestuariivirga litoralis]|uniref:hypothetical protein n=1 Tax=Aestuariivirga litoralis TaxID=2650924 RepID=UPI0018C59BC8|nr:hypothetical protein [Aestuariivirga litoralis]MBG1232170.1 hypothetical protein [Aestuariivirga litoralis]
MSRKHAAKTVLVQRLGRNFGWAMVMIVIAMIVGMVGYIYYGDDVTVAGSFADAAMILSGQGPLDQMKTPAGQIFEGIYALVCGFLFFAIAGYALSPALHHVLRSFHLEDEDREAAIDAAKKK